LDPLFLQLFWGHFFADFLGSKTMAENVDKKWTEKMSGREENVGKKMLTESFEVAREKSKRGPTF